MWAVGNEQLGEDEVAVICPLCGKLHAIEYGTSQRLINGEWEEPKPSRTLGFYRCQEKIYLGTIRGKLSKGRSQ